MYIAHNKILLSLFFLGYILKKNEIKVTMKSGIELSVFTSWTKREIKETASLLDNDKGNNIMIEPQPSREIMGSLLKSESPKWNAE